MVESEAKPRQVSFVIGGLSFIPLVGVIFGLIAIGVGLSTSRPGGKTLAAVGGGGIAFTIFLYGSLFYFGFVQRGGVYDGLRAGLAQTELNELVPAIEMYKLQHGSYPENLDILRKSLPNDSTVFIYDPSDTRLANTPREFYYKRVGVSHYYLRGVGPDGIPFTHDDLLPEIEGTRANVGLLKNRPPS